MNPRVYPVTNDNTPTLRLLLSATTGIRNHRWLLHIPFNGLKYDDRSTQLCLPFNLKGVSFNSPIGTRLISAVPRRDAFPDEVRSSVIVGLDLWFESDSTASAFTNQPLLLAFDGAANDAVNSLGAVTFPTVTATSGTPWTVNIPGGSPLGVEIFSYPSAATRRYTGSWNAQTNTPTLASGSGTRGALYQVSVAGSTVLDGISSWAVNDELYFDGHNWQKIPAYDSGLGTFAFKNDQEIVFDLEDFTGNINLTATEIKYQIWRLAGKTGGNINFIFPAGQQGTFRIIDETIRGLDTDSKEPYQISVANSGGQTGAIAAALRPTVQELFVLSRVSGTIAVLDSQNGKLLRVFSPTGMSNPQAMVFSSDGIRLYATLGSGKVQVIDPSDGTLLQTYNLNVNADGDDDASVHVVAEDILWDGDHHLLWVACQGNDSDPQTRLARVDLLAEDHPVRLIPLVDGIDPIDNRYGLRHIRANSDFTEIYLWGLSGTGSDDFSTKRFYIFDVGEETFAGVDVGGNSGGGLEVDDHTIYISRGGRSIRLLDLVTHANIGGITGGNRLVHLLKDGAALYCSNTDDNTITVYDDVSDLTLSREIPTAYNPGMLVPVTVDSQRLIWVVFPNNNAVGLISPVDGQVQRFTPLGAVTTLVLDQPVTDLVNDGARIWTPGGEAEQGAALTALGSPVLDLQSYFESGFTTTEQTRFFVWRVRGYTNSDSPDVPYARVARTAGVGLDQIYSDYIPVRRGARLHFSVWLMRPTGAAGPDEAHPYQPGSFSLSLDILDRKLRPAGTVGIISNNPPADGVWRELTFDYDLPLTHTPVDNSDGGPICYIRVQGRVNQPTGDYDGIMQEIQWSRVRVEYVPTTRTQTLYANAATATATVQCGSGTFTVTAGASAATVQAAVRALGGVHAAVTVTGGVNAGPGSRTGSYLFTWATAAILPPLLVTSPNNGTWTTGLEYIVAPAIPFTELTDVPGDYTTHAGQLVAVKDDETGLEFVDAPSTLPTGGTTGQILTKASSADFDATWNDAPTGTAFDPDTIVTFDGEVVIFDGNVVIAP